MKSANRELVDRLAAEYVLGTLRGRARRRFERWLVSPQVGALVTAWEDRLAGLEPPLKGVTPPAAAWQGIENRLGLRKLRRTPLTRWLAVAASIALVALVSVFALRWTEPGVTQKAFIQANAQTIYWRVELLGDNEELSLHVHQVHDLPAGKSHELWVIPAGAGAAPVSLGLLPHTGDHHRVLTAAQRAALKGATTIAVSLEPEGGSPNGSPTEVLLTAPLAAA